MATRSQKARMRRAYLKRQQTRLNPDLYRYVQGQVNYEDKFLSSLFRVPIGDVTSPTFNRMRTDFKTNIIPETKVQDNVTVLDGSIIKMWMFWRKIDGGLFYYFVELHTVNAIVRRSKLYPGRMNAHLAYKDNKITWVLKHRMVSGDLNQVK